MVFLTNGTVTSWSFVIAVGRFGTIVPVPRSILESVFTDLIILQIAKQVYFQTSECQASRFYPPVVFMLR